MLRYSEEMCMFCAGCSAVCPPGIITVFASHLEIEYSECTSCGNCVMVCPAGALEL